MTAPKDQPVLDADGIITPRWLKFLNALQAAGSYQPLDATLTALAALDSTAGIVYQTGADTFTKFSVVGLVGSFPSTSVPSGWLALDGSNRSRTTYAALFAYLGTAFGSGDGSTTFGTPDGRGRAIFGYDAANATGRLTLSATGGLSAAAIGNTGGEQAHIIITAELASHFHTIFGASTVGLGAGSAFRQLAASSGASNVSSASAGSDAAHNTVPPGIVFQWCIFAGA